MIATGEWFGLYSGSWNGEIVPAAYAHPAKFSRLLIARIYQHAIEQGYLTAGDNVIDPFGGVGLGAVDAITRGINWTGVELEAHFQELGQQNIALWNERYGRYCAATGKPFGRATLLQGDSRNLVSIVVPSSACISSPPYAASLNSEKNGIDWKKVKPDYPGRVMHDERIEMAERHHNERRYGSTAGQLGSMREGDFEACVSSPPYADSLQPETAEQTARKQDRIAKAKSIYDGRRLEAPSPGKAAIGGGYGITPGNLGSMKDQEFSAAISSPPYADAINGSGEGPGARTARDWHRGWGENGKTSSQEQYGRTPGNLGNLSGGYEAAVSSPPFEGVLPKPNKDPETITIRPNAPDIASISKYLKDRRLELGMSQKEVSKHFPSDSGGLTGCVSNWELGYNMPTPEQWARLKTILGFDDSFDDGMLTEVVVRANGINTSRRLGIVHGATYGVSPGNIGNDQGESFWTAARAIVEQVYTVLKPGGVAIWVCGDFVRNGRRVYFGRQWLALCQACGFLPLEWVVAHKWESRGVQLDLLGNEVERKVSRVSFFRRLANERNPDEAIENEDILIVRKPAVQP